MSWAVTRSLVSARRTLPSRTVRTRSCSPIVRMSCVAPLNANDEVRDATRSEATPESAFTISSVMPSLKYSLSGSALRFTNGNTAIEFAATAAAGTGVATGSATVVALGAVSAARGKPIGRRPGEHPRHRLLEPVGHGIPHRAQARHGLERLPRQDRLRRPPGERQVPRQHLVQHAAEAVEIAATIKLVDPLRLLRAHVAGRADGDTRARHPPPPSPPSSACRYPDRAGDAEVAHHGVTRLEEDILRLDIAMHDVAPVRVVQGVRHLAGDVQRVVQRELVLAHQATAQRFTLHVGHHVVEETIRFAGVMQWQDVGMGEPGGDLDLTEEAVRAQLGGQVRAEHFERDGPAVFQVLRQVHGRHAPAAELPFDRIVLSQGGLEAARETAHAAKDRAGVGGRRAKGPRR